MQLFTLLVLLCLSIAQVSASPPILAHSFFASLELSVSTRDGNFSGKGYWAQDGGNGKSVEVHSFGMASSALDKHTIQRFDLGVQYSLVQVPAGADLRCQEFALDGAVVPDVWRWMADSTFIGQESHDGQSVNVFRSNQIGYATLTLAVDASDYSRPIWFKREAPEKVTTMYFRSWEASTPESNWFNVPESCTNQPLMPSGNETLTCVSSSTIIAAAQVWVAAKVPYNQGATYMGYREDCSGYVSYCWGDSKPGHTTSTMSQIAKPISKSQLQPGDCLLFAGDHVVLFGGWTDASQTQYTAFEETRPGEGTVSRATPYPYWYSTSDFLPYRYNNFCG